MNSDLSPESKGILDELIHYEREKLLAFEKRRDRHRRAAKVDGKYSLIRLLNAMREDKVASQAPFELMASDAISVEVGRPPAFGYQFVPVSSLRDLTAGSAGGGGYAVGHETAPGDIFQGALLSKSVISNLGARIVSLRGQATFPRVSGGISTFWLPTESTALTESQFAFAVAAAVPHTAGCYLEASDQFLRQTSPAAADFILSEMGRATASEVDGKILSGSGSAGQPLGVLGQGIGSVSGATIEWGDVLDAIEDVEDGNALTDSAGWAIEPSVAKLLRGREKVTGSGLMIMDTALAGYKSLVSNSVPAATAIFGSWDNVLLCEWGVLEIGTDPYGAGSALFKNRLVGIRALWTCDVILLAPSAFSAITSIS